ncbi:MAG: hypothetical protein ACI9YH_004903 [Colwellia sp.]|jgi:hypothetical protein
MNIQKLISSVRAARKLRILNNFHRDPRGGIDVSTEELNDVLQILKDLFKLFKTQKCHIEISFYGEIFITLNESKHRFELSITNRPNINKPEELLKKLESTVFLKLNNIDLNNTLTVSIKTMRPRSLWKHYLISEYNNNMSFLVESIIKETYQRVRYYNTPTQGDIELNSSRTEDKLAVIHLGGALLGSSSMLFYLSKALHKIIYVKDLSISNNRININKSYLREETNHYFGKKESAFFEKYLMGYNALDVSESDELSVTMKQGEVVLSKFLKLDIPKALYEELSVFYKGDEAIIYKWLHTPKSLLDGNIPIKLVETKLGLESVLDLINRLKIGDLS